MSTIALDYSNSLQFRRSANVPWIVILIAGLVLVSSIVLVAGSASVKVDDSSGVVAVSVPTPPAIDVPTIPSETPAPFASEIEQSVVAVPVPTP